MKTIPDFVCKYPMGPALRGWIGLADSEYFGHDSGVPSPEEEEALGSWLLDFASDKPLESVSQFTDIIEELVGMSLALPALKLVGYFPDLLDDDDFRTHFQIGNAAMIGGDVALAEASFRKAQELIPEETAPYINLTQIYFHEQRDAEARTWCMAGLDADHNNIKLWELLATLEAAEMGLEGACKKILTLAEERTSWAGLSLACEMANPENPEMKLGYLETLYHQGLRDSEFLIELTAVMGAAGKYDQIAPVVWQAEKLGSGTLPWQLWMHAAQAQLGLGKNDLCKEYLEKVRKMPKLPDSVPPVLDQLFQEASEV